MPADPRSGLLSGCWGDFMHCQLPGGGHCPQNGSATIRRQRSDHRAGVRHGADLVAKHLRGAGETVFAQQPVDAVADGVRRRILWRECERSARRCAYLSVPELICTLRQHQLRQAKRHRTEHHARAALRHHGIAAWQHAGQWHEALDQQTPASVYQSSPREMPNKLPPLAYPDRFEVRYVSANGGIRWRSDWVNVSIVCAGEYVGLEEIDDGIWNVYFGPLKLGRLHERHMRIEDEYGRLKRHKV